MYYGYTCPLTCKLIKKKWWINCLPRVDVRSCFLFLFSLSYLKEWFVWGFCNIYQICAHFSTGFCALPLHRWRDWVRNGLLHFGETEWQVMSMIRAPLHKTFCRSFLRQKSGNSGKKKISIAICIEICQSFFYGKEKSKGKKFYATGPR